MRALVTGANGFLGRHVVDAFVRRGHSVRALVRPAARVDGIWETRVDLFRADLRSGEPLDPAFEDVDVLVHLAAAMRADEVEQVAATVAGTQRLLEAMGRSATRRIVLASSIAVYDWSRTNGVLTEESPLERDVYARGSYTTAKAWQERIARRLAEAHGFDVTVLRPGFVWGRGGDYVAGTGAQFGSLHVVVGARRALPLTYVENCADAFALAAEHPAAIGETFNVFDDEEVDAWRYTAAYLRGRGEHGRRVAVPYSVARGVTLLADATNRVLFGGRAKLPKILQPRLFEARAKPLRFRGDKLHETIGWRPRYGFVEAAERAWGEEAARG